jgi:CheY-specific phosphatase CheX
VTPKSLETLDALIGSACRALFESVGAKLEPVDKVVSAGDDVGATIGFTGSVLRGALVMISTKRLIQKVLPPEIVPGASDTQVADWMGELTNQLLGRIKNKLLSYGVTLEMSTPTVIFGLELARKDTGASVRRHLAFRHENHPLLISFDAVGAPDLELSIPEEPVDPGIAEGELALF